MIKTMVTKSGLIKGVGLGGIWIANLPDILYMENPKESYTKILIR
jgi:hypothetical protein